MRHAVTEGELEQAITDACTQLSMATTCESQELIFARIQVLYGMRSAEMIERLEQMWSSRK